MGRKAVLEICNICKVFPGVKALDDVSFEIQDGTVHALVGENGAGKSTLIKILAGIYHPDSGTVLLNGEKLVCKAPVDAQRAGISVIHQEIKLSEPLSVTENIFLGNLIFKKNRLTDWKSMREKANEMVTSLGLELDVDAIVSTLSVAKKQVVEICKALVRDARVIIMDEPSATLTDRELNVLFDTVRSLRNRGYTIIYISHRLDEIFNLANNVTVLRDGQHIRTLPISEVTRESLISMMVGREMDKEFVRHTSPVKPNAILEIENLSSATGIKNISLKVYEGEVLGLSGLVGAGRTELARAILGIDPITEGKIIFRGQEKKWNFYGAIKNGLGLVPEDRKGQGLVLEASVKKNITMTAIDKILKKGLVDFAVEEEYAKHYIDLLKVSTPSTETNVENLSGGNQQKVVIARWLMQNSDVLFLDEPTRGVDVGAKREIYEIVKQLADEGKTIIVISSEMQELIGICDRIAVISGGRLMGELSHEDATQEKILSLCV